MYIYILLKNDNNSPIVKVLVTEVTTEFIQNRSALCFSYFYPMLPTFLWLNSTILDGEVTRSLG